MSSELTNSSSKKHSNPLNTDFSKITSYPMLESIIKTLSNPGVVQMAIRHYANFPETTVGKE